MRQYRTSVQSMMRVGEVGSGRWPCGRRNSALLIDGKTIDGRGTLPDGQSGHRGSAGSRRRRRHGPRHRGRAAGAFDPTDWSRDRNFGCGGNCATQCATARRRTTRNRTISECGAPRMLTAAAQLEAGPVGGPFAADTAESYLWHPASRWASPIGNSRTEAVGVAGAITPWNFPPDQFLVRSGASRGDNCHFKAGAWTHRGAAALGELSPSTPTSPALSTSSPPAVTLTPSGG